MDKRGWIIFVVAVVGIFAGLVVFSRQSKVDVASYDNGAILTASDKPEGAIADHTFGLSEPDTKVILVEYGDFQCPGCGQLHKTMQPLLAEYEDKIAFVYRHFPLTQIHPNARAAASAAEAAGLQDKYWPMHNKLFDSQAAWENLSVDKRDDMFSSYAESLQLDMDKFKKDYASETVAGKINFDQALGKDNGVNATPTLFLNGKKLESNQFASIDELKSTLDKALKDAGVDTKDSDKEANKDDK